MTKNKKGIEIDTSGQGVETKDDSDFLKRRESFEKSLLELQKKESMELYAANIVLPNHEVAPVIKIMDTKKK